MTLTRKQEEGLNLAVQRHRNKEKLTVISGYAGSGKSTLVKFIIEALDVSQDKVCYAAFTGKAAQVLAKKGNKNCITLHRLLYDSVPRPAGGFVRIPKKNLDYTVIVVDEVSMAPKFLMDLLFTHNAYVIALGDPFQLPTISPEDDNHLLDNPHIFLDEIMRQAQESEIIRLTMDVRNNAHIPHQKGSQVQVVGKKSLVTGMYNWADQVLVATNLMRHSVNDQIRKMKGFGELPEDGDKVICLRNYWDFAGKSGVCDPLTNGTVGIIRAPEEGVRHVPFYAYNPGKINIINASFSSDFGDEYGQIEMDPKIILGGESELEWRDKYKLGKLRNKIGDVIPKEFAFGYAITCHKAQGSEWDKVLVIEETFPRPKLDHQRWLYTALTRASEKLVLVRPY